MVYGFVRRFGSNTFLKTSEWKVLTRGIMGHGVAWFRMVSHGFAWRLAIPALTSKLLPVAIKHLYSKREVGSYSFDKDRI